MTVRSIVFFSIFVFTHTLSIRAENTDRVLLTEEQKDSVTTYKEEASDKVDIRKAPSEEKGADPQNLPAEIWAAGAATAGAALVFLPEILKTITDSEARVRYVDLLLENRVDGSFLAHGSNSLYLGHLVRHGFTSEHPLLPTLQKIQAWVLRMQKEAGLEPHRFNSTLHEVTHHHFEQHSVYFSPQRSKVIEFTGKCGGEMLEPVREILESVQPENLRKSDLPLYYLARELSDLGYRSSPIAVELRQSRWPAPVLNPDRDEYTVRPVIFPEELMFEVENRDSGKAIRPESITAGRNIADQVLSRLHRGESTISLPLDTVLLLRLTPVERRSEFSGLRDWQLVRNPYPARAGNNRELTLEFQYNPLPPLADDVIRMRHTARMEIAKSLGLDPERNWHDEVSQRSGLHARQWWNTEATRAALKAIKNHSGKITIACAALITMTQVFFRNNSQSLNAMSNQAERISAAR